MMKITALNEEVKEESDDEDVPTITKEAQEQIALTEYNKALELIKQNKKEDALNIFKDLLETELLDQVEKPETPDGRYRPMLSLKYSCFKNIGAIQVELENYEEAIENYWEAANLDDTDVTLWYRLGMLAMKTSKLIFACTSFKQGLKCNPNHWPCLDNIITALYAVPNYMSCLLYISMALERDPSYVKGLAFREKIYKDIPYFQECYKIYNVDWALDPPLSTEYDHVFGDKLLAEAHELASKWAESCKPEYTRKPLPDLALRRPLTKYTWYELGESLVDMHRYIAEHDDLNFVSRIKLEVLKPAEQTIEVNTNENNIKGENEMEVDGGIEENLKEKDEDGEKISKADIDNENIEMFVNFNDDGVFDNDLETGMEVEIEDDRKSSSSDIQIIEDEDPLRIESEILQFEQPTHETNTDFDEPVIMGIDITSEKSHNDKILENISNLDKFSGTEVVDLKASSKGSDKSNDNILEKRNEKSNEKSLKSDEKSNEKTEMKEEGQKVKKKRRNSLIFLQQWAWSGSSMRRSARVRSSNKRETERDDVQLEENLRRLFPSTLLPDTVKLTKEDPTKGIEDSMNTMDLYQLFENRENNSNMTDGTKSSESSKPPSPDVSDQQEKYFDTEDEIADVNAFINDHSGKSNLMIIIARFTEFLCTKWNHEWPKGMTDLYIQAYMFTREHIPHPSPFGDETDDSILKSDAEMTLLFGELHTDKWLNDKPDILPHSTIDKLGTGIPSEELGQIIFTSARDDLFKEQYTPFLIRLLWLKANIFLCQGDTDIVIGTLELLLNHLRNLDATRRSMILKLPNCKYISHVSTRIVEKMLISIQRSRKLGEIQYLYDEKKYAELASILQDTFKFAKQRPKLMPNAEVIVDRVQQLAMLLDSLWQLQRYEDCYVWAEACLSEAWQNYINASESEQKKWIGSVLNALEKLDACTTEVSAFIVTYLPEGRISRLVQNLVHIVCHQLDVPENSVAMPVETVLPWILLHYILQYEEDKERAKPVTPVKHKTQNSHNSESEDEDEDIPPSLMILFTAHEFLGRHSWCCANEAKLLFFTMNLIIPRLRSPLYAPRKGKLTKFLEQIFFCLYAHPNRTNNKGKPKHLEDHGVYAIPDALTWEGAQLLFDFYKPDTLPDVQSHKTVSINAETEALFRKITRLVPRESDPNYITEKMIAYILGEREKMPSVEKPLPYQISSIYYLLGDYYFKNSKWQDAYRYYLLDLCLNPTRSCSWAALAMATGTQMENSLNDGTTLKLNENKFLDKAKIAQCSYQRAVDLAPHLLYWIEYGNFVYTIHSYCSRLLKQESDTLSMERFEILETRKENMLDLAAHCFLSANRVFIASQAIDNSTEVHDERWLHQYMLAKIAEKKNEDPPVFLEHYAKASELLYENNAHYPRRINYKNPQNLSIEALEVHYRIHASILKYLEQHEGKPLKKSLGQLFQQYLKNCAEGPFMKYQSKLTDKKKEDGSDSDSRHIMRDNENLLETSKNVVTIQQRSNSIEEIEIIDKTNVKVDFTKSTEQGKNESRKRSPEDMMPDNNKKIKLGSISHLQLMQDVVALIDDLITKVCDMVTRKNVTADDIMILSSDEGDEQISQRAKKDSSESGKVQGKTNETKNHNQDTKSEEDRLEMVVKDGNIQDLMDVLMKEAMEGQETQQSTPDEEDTRKSDGKWLQNEDVQAQAQDKECKDRPEEKKKTQIETVKEEVTLSRRGSQESTTTTQTTTTTETNNSSSSSSDDSTSSDDSSDSDSSSESDSESESDADKKKKDTEFKEKEEYLSEEEVATLIAYCLAGLEQCVLRFREHYKSLYRLSHFFFNNKIAKDTAKCRDLLLGTYNCQFYPGQSFPGLFADRKGTNFFNGIWRIPSGEIDRPGSFASHMSRCVTLLMQVLKETDDSRMLMELCVQLRKTPEADKKYLRDSEREQLSCQALTMCLQSLRTRIQSMGTINASESTHPSKPDSKAQVLIDIYKIYQQVQKNFQGKESTIHTFASLLSDTYKTYTGQKNTDGNTLENATKFCQQQILAMKNMASNSTSHINVQTPTAASSPVTIPLAQTMPTSPQISQSRKPYRASSSSGRPRGRPPNVNKYLQAAQQSGNLLNQFNPKGGFGNYLGLPNNPALLSAYFMNPLLDSNMIPAMLASGLSGNMMNPLSAMYLNQIGCYQDMVRQFQNLPAMSNLNSGLSNSSSSVPNISNVLTMSTAGSNVNTSSSMSHLSNLNNSGSLTVQQLLNLSSTVASTSRSTPTYQQATTKTTTTTSTTKERPNISITPVSTLLSQKTKSSRQGSHADALPAHMSKPLQLPQPSKSVLHPPTTQVSLLKPSVMQQVKSIPPKQMSAPQIRVSKSLIEPQPAHNSSLSHSPLKNNNPSNPNALPQVAHTSLNSSLNLKPSIPMNLQSSRTGTSLQHKLLSKKHLHRSQLPPNIQNPMKKKKAPNIVPSMPNNFQSLINTMSAAPPMTQSAFLPAELNAISVSAISSSAQKSSKVPGYRKPSKSKAPSMDITSSMTSALPQTNSVEALSMLSQLQQHSHLEIIPQQKSQMKSSIDFSKNLPTALSVVQQKISDTARPASSDCMSVYELSRGKPSGISSSISKKADKLAKDSVEIITLDD